MKTDFAKILVEGEFPKETSNFSKDLLLPNENGAAVAAQESEFLDFKDKFPHSKSDSYCASIVRLIVAFHNTFGGFIVFGVQDETGETGTNNIHVTLEALTKKVKEVTGARIRLRHLHISELNVDLVLVAKRPIETSPVYLIKDFDKEKEKGKKFPAEMTWIRIDQECCIVEGKHLPELLSHRNLDNNDDFSERTIQNIFPPSRAIIEEMVGRSI